MRPAPTHETPTSVPAPMQTALNRPNTPVKFGQRDCARRLGAVSPRSNKFAPTGRAVKVSASVYHRLAEAINARGGMILVRGKRTRRFPSPSALSSSLRVRGKGLRADVGRTAAGSRIHSRESSEFQRRLHRAELAQLDRVSRVQRTRCTPRANLARHVFLSGEQSGTGHSRQ